MRYENCKSIKIVGFALLICVLASRAQDVVENVAPPSVIFEALALNKDLPTLTKPKYRSPTDLVTSPDEKKIYLCEQTAKRITVFDVEAGAVEPERIQLPNEVTGCVVSSDGGTLYATIGSDWWPAGYVCVVDIPSRRVTKRVGVGYYPRSPVLSSDGTLLYVCNVFSHTVSVIDVGTGTVKDTIHAIREPYAMDITPDGKTLVVGNLLPDEVSTDTSFITSKILIIDVATHQQDTVRLTRGSNSILGMTVSPDGKYAFATHLINKYDLIGTMVEKGWLHTNNLAVIDLESKKFVNDVCLDLTVIGMGNPWGVKCTKDGKYIAVAHAGAGELSIIRLQEMMTAVLDSTAMGIDLQKNFTVLLDSRKRFPVATKGPRALTIVGSSVYTAGYFDDMAASMEEFKVDSSTSRSIATYQIGDPQFWTGERHGECSFYDASLCFQKWQSCHSCHPFGRTNTLNGILGGGAVTAPIQKKSVLYSWWTPPTNWAGSRSHAQQSVVSMIELQMYQTPTREIAAPIDTFLMNIKPVRSPQLIKGALSGPASRGKSLFFGDKTGCTGCHKAPLFCDSLLHEAGVPDPYDSRTEWNTPSLAEAWRTGPYGHLGSYRSIRGMIEVPGHNNAPANLTSEEIDDLVAYVLSL